MTIKQQGGVFGRNPTFNDVEVNTLTADGDAFVKALGVNATSLTSVSGFGFGSFNGSNGGGIVLQQSGTPKASIASFGNDQYIDAVGKTVIRTGATVTGAPVNVMEFQADRNVKMSAGNLAFLNGNGIDFSATAGTGTSELLDDYEEGTWTPNQGVGLTVVGAFSSSGTYTKVGRSVTVTGGVSGATSIAGISGSAICTNLPFTASGAFAGSAGVGNVNQGSSVISYSTTVYLATEITATAGITFTVTYEV